MFLISDSSFRRQQKGASSVKERVRKHRERRKEPISKLLEWARKRNGLGFSPPTENEVLEGKGFVVFGEMVYLT